MGGRSIVRCIATIHPAICSFIVIVKHDQTVSRPKTHTLPRAAQRDPRLRRLAGGADQRGARPGAQAARAHIQGARGGMDGRRVKEWMDGIDHLSMTG